MIPSVLRPLIQVRKTPPKKRHSVTLSRLKHVPYCETNNLELHRYRLDISSFGVACAVKCESSHVCIHSAGDDFALTRVMLDAGRWGVQPGPAHQPLHGPSGTTAGQTPGILHHAHRGTAVQLLRLSRPHTWTMGGTQPGGRRARDHGEWGGGGWGYRRGRHVHQLRGIT